MLRDIDDVEPAAESARFFVQTWAETVLEQVAVARAARAALDGAERTLDRVERYGEGPADAFEAEVHDLFRKMWTAEHMVVWSAHQLEIWSARLANERGEKRRKENVKLKHLRDALEHLDQADLVGGYAVAKPTGKQTRSLRKLPNASIMIGWGSRLLFGNVSGDEIEETALVIVESVRTELDAEFNALVDEAEAAEVDRAIDELRGR